LQKTSAKESQSPLRTYASPSFSSSFLSWCQHVHRVYKSLSKHIISIYYFRKTWFSLQLIKTILTEENEWERDSTTSRETRTCCAVNMNHEAQKMNDMRVIELIMRLERYSAKSERIHDTLTFAPILLSLYHERWDMRVENLGWSSVSALKSISFPWSSPSSSSASSTSSSLSFPTSNFCFGRKNL
jgi:hypothetical protein